MMQILEAAGIAAFTDGKRHADESNKKGYYEHDKVTSLLSTPDKSWLRDARGKAVKIVTPLLAGLPLKLRKPEAEPQPLHYRILYMERGMEEILQSQETMLQRLDRSPASAEKAADIGKAYRQQAVSYTHLDVYKRQDLAPLSRRFFGWIKPISSC